MNDGDFCISIVNIKIAILMLLVKQVMPGFALWLDHVLVLEPEPYMKRDGPASLVVISVLILDGKEQSLLFDLFKAFD